MDIFNDDEVLAKLEKAWTTPDDIEPGPTVQSHAPGEKRHKNSTPIQERDRELMIKIEEFWIENGYGPTVAELHTLGDCADAKSAYRTADRLVGLGLISLVDVGDSCRMVWPTGVSVAVHSPRLGQIATYTGGIWKSTNPPTAQKSPTAQK